MPAKSATSRKWIAGGLHAARAVAFLTIATGVNGTLSAIWPHYEPIYAYLAAVVLVAFLSSAILGVTAAVAAVILYDWMFSPVRVVPSMSIAVPIAVALLVVLATRAAVPLLRRPALARPATEPPLLPAVDAARPAEAHRVDVVDDGRMAALTQQLATARSKYEDESRLRAATESSAREREGQLEKELEAVRARLEDQGNRSLASRREVDEMRERLTQAENRATALQQGLDAAQRRADEEHARAAREITLREQLEVAGHESLQNAVSGISSKYEATLLESKQRLEVAMKRLESTQRELKEERARSEREAFNRAQFTNTDHEQLQKNFAELAARHEAVTVEAQKRVEAAAAKINAMQRELDRTLASLSEEHARADREARLRTQLESAARETLHRTADVSAGHQREASEARRAAEAAEERALAAEQRARIAEQRLQAVQEQIRTAGERAAASEQRALAAEQQIRDAEQRPHVQMRAADERAAASEQRALAAEQQAETAEQRARAAEEQTRAADDRATASEQRALALVQQFEQARFELSELRTSHEMHRNAAAAAEDRVLAMQNELEQLRGAGEDRVRTAEAELATLKRHLDRARRDVEQQQLRDDLDAAAHAKLSAEAAAARQESESLRAQVIAERTQREANTREFDERLKRIVDGINADYENAIGEALIEKESVKAELRALTKKLQQTQAVGDAERAEMNRAFDEKLQRIVAGVTADYENSIGDSLLEKEGAKAEMRKMSKKIAELQARIDDEKKSREQIDAEWSEKLQKIVTHLAEDHEADIGEAIVEKQAARAEARTLSSRVAALQQRLEEEREKFRQTAERWQQERVSIPRRPITPTVEQELPVAARAPVILIVHSDPNVRSTSKQSLEESGYTVLTAADGLEGLRIATQQKPDVVVAEAVMPKMNARELVQLLKSRRETSEIKLILLSASGDSERGSDFRADEILRDPGELRTALASVLTRRGVPS